MHALRILLRAVLLTSAVTWTVAVACPACRRVLDEPSPAVDPFYYVDYEKRQDYRTRLIFTWGWGWVAGLVVGLPFGVAYYWWARRFRQSNQRRESTRMGGEREDTA